MVYYLAVFSFLLVATVFSEPVNGPLEEQAKNIINNAAIVSTTDKPMEKETRVLQPLINNVRQDSKCPHAVTLLQLLATLLEFLHHSIETDKVNKVVAVMKNHLENIPLRSDKDELNVILKYIEDNLHKNSPLHDYLTTGLPNDKSKTSIVFKNEVPNLTQPNCKNEFSKLMQKAYNDYIDLAKLPNCHHTGFPSNDALNFPNENQNYAFDINYSQPLDSSSPSNDNHNFNTIPFLHNPSGEILPFYNIPNKSPENIDNLPKTNNNPLNILNGILQPQLLDIWTVIKNNPSQYGTIINQYLKDHPEHITELLKPISYFAGNPTADTNILSHYLTTDLKNLNIQNHLPGGTLPISNHYVNNSTISSNIPRFDGINLMPSVENNQINTPNNNIDYTVLLSQLGLLNKPDGNNENNNRLNNNNPLDKIISLYDPSLSSNNPNILGNDLTLNSNPISSSINSPNGIPNLISGDNQNNKEAYLDKKRIPLQLDRFTVSHDRTPLILEYIASLKNPANQNSYNEILNNNYDVHVADNKLVSPDLSQLNAVANLGKNTNKAGIIELTYVLKRPQPLVYHPVYYVKYRLPYTKFIQNYRNLVSQNPTLRSKPTNIYQELVSLSNITEVSPVLAGYDKEKILKLMVNNSTLVKAKLIDAKNDDLNEQLEIIRELNSDATPGDIHLMTDTALNQFNSLLNASRKKLNNVPTSG